jgi:hypothetical protein
MGGRPSAENLLKNRILMAFDEKQEKGEQNDGSSLGKKKN